MWWSLFLCPLLSLAPAPARELDCSQLAAALLTELGAEDAAPGEVGMAELVRDGCIGAPLGLFDVYMPAASLLDESTAASSYRSLCLALLDLQKRWNEWLAPASPEAAQAARELAEVRAWVEGWDLAALMALAEAGGGSLLDSPLASDEVRPAVRAFADRMASGASVGLERSVEEREPIVLVPDRRRFVSFVCLGGWLYPDLQHVFWQPSIVDWTNTYIDEFKILALEFAAPGHDPDDIDAAMGMNERSSTGMKQQIVQLAANSLLDRIYGGRISPALAGGLALNLVIDLYGEANTRVDGDLRARRTEAREMFVPGGASTGGTLAVNPADSRWRQGGHGADRFIGVLRRSQKDASARVERGVSKTANFTLIDDAGLERTQIAGPFLGSAASQTTAPTEPYIGDYLEFLRAYRCAFVWWLQNESTGKEAEADFAGFLLGMAGASDASELEAVLEASFELPLSSTELDKKGELEGAFLQWLSKR